MSFLVNHPDPIEQNPAQRTAFNDLSHDVLTNIMRQLGNIAPSKISGMQLTSRKLGNAIADVRPNAAIVSKTPFPNGNGLLQKLNNLSAKTTLIELGLRNCNLRATGGQLLAQFLQGNTTLLKLDVGSNYLQIAGGIAVAQALRFHPAIRELDVSRNSMGINDGGLQAGSVFAHLLQSNSTLTCLNIGNNQMQADAVSSLIVPLRKSTRNANKRLSSLDLSGNILYSEVACVELSNLLCDNDTLTHLYLRNTRITGRGVDHIMEGMQLNTTLLCLDMRDITWSGKHQLWSAEYRDLHERVWKSERPPYASFD